MKPLSILTVVVAISCTGHRNKEVLFNTLHKNTFASKYQVTIEFVDSTSYIVRSGDSATRMDKGAWHIEDRLTGTYLIMNSSEMKLETLSDTVLTFTAGEFTPRFVKVRK